MTYRRNIYIDTNVLINYCTNIGDGGDAIRYLCRVRKKSNLFISSLSLVQTISAIQASNEKNQRKGFSRAETKKWINRLKDKFRVIEFKSKKINDAFELNNEDVEDNVQYLISKDFNCDVIITNNIKDFNNFKGIIPIKPKLALVRSEIKSR